ncbi:hypothetical protein [Methanorbis rubei]|uniref:DUF3784 domain-containing protein n=1 Tax=Methanorbis rubei TaxID=3028300 RepID=A0AAE4MFX8_9EURY|nr:hypothetical protein [Methanocorpusculaceae archaeon Cs1]
MITELGADSFIMAFCCWICGFIFLCIGIWAYRSKKPIHFWAGSTVSPAEISDVSAYNKANAVLWTVYSIPYFVIGVLGFFVETTIAGILLVIVCVGGLPVLVFAYLRIYKKYHQ